MIKRISDFAKSVLPVIALLTIIGGALAYPLNDYTQRWIRSLGFVSQDEVSGLREEIVDLTAALEELRVSIELANETSGRPCAIIPASGHRIENGPIGVWLNVTWRRVDRLRADCGKPVISAIVRNGRGLLHGAETSIPGLALPLGPNDISYAFRMHEGVEPGPAEFQVTVSFPDAVGGAPLAQSPWLPFTILSQEN